MKEAELLKKYGSPIYVYREDILRERANDLLDFAKMLEGMLKIKVSMHYSTKANNNLRILKILKETGMKADSMSPVELQIAEKAGFKLSDLIYVCNNVSQEEMAYVADKGVQLCMDSVEQVRMLGEIRPGTNVVIRINPEEGGVGLCDKVITAGKNARFGIVERDLDDLLKIAEKYNIKITGVHQHLGSCFLDGDVSKYMMGLKAGIEMIKKYLPDIEIFDAGGGFGVPYGNEEKNLNFKMFAEEFSKNFKGFLEKSKIKEIKFEPGRYPVCEAGCILGQVNSIKQSFSKTWVGTDVGMNVLIRPAMYGAVHKIEILPKEFRNEHIIATISGNVCEEGDILGEDVEILKPEAGDIIKIHDAGAYGYSMSSDYTGRLTTAEVLINLQGKDELIRRRETIADVMGRF